MKMGAAEWKIFISKISSLVCVCPARFKKGNPNRHGKSLEKKLKNAQSPIIDTPSDRPDRQHGNPLKPDRTRDDEGKKLGQCDRCRITANFPHPRFPSIPSMLWRIQR